MADMSDRNSPQRQTAAIRFEEALRQIADGDHLTNMLGTGCVGAAITVHQNDGSGRFVPVERVNCPACFAQEVLDGER